MGIQVDSDNEVDEMPISNPLPPPPRPHEKDKRNKESAEAPAENLSNADFRKMVMDTPRRGDDKNKDRPRRFVSYPCGIRIGHRHAYISSCNVTSCKLSIVNGSLIIVTWN